MSAIANARKIRNYILSAFPRAAFASYASRGDFVIEIRLPGALQDKEAIEFAKAIGTDPRQSSLF